MAEEQDAKSASLETMVDMIVGKRGKEGDGMGDNVSHVEDEGGEEENDMLTKNKERSHKGVLLSGNKEDHKKACSVCCSGGLVFRCGKYCS